MQPGQWGISAFGGVLVSSASSKSPHYPVSNTFSTPRSICCQDRMGRLRLLLKSASNVGMLDDEPMTQPQLTTCEITFRGQRQCSTTHEQKTTADNVEWNQLFEWSLDSAPEADDKITVSIVYKDVSKSTREQCRATAEIIDLDNIINGEERQVPTTRHDNSLKMELFVLLTYWELDYGVLHEEKERLEIEEEKLKRNLEKKDEQHVEDQELLRQVREDLKRDKQEKKKLKQDMLGLQLEKQRLEREKDRLEKRLADDKERFQEDEKCIKELREQKKKLERNDARLQQQLERLKSLAEQMLENDELD